LAIARGLLRDSKIYIFDEATSNIDAESENEIIKLLYSFKNKKTIILISHRLFNVVDSDNIYLLKDGELIEEGKHNELLDKSGDYKKLWEMQRKLEGYRKEEAI
jgi:ABC-type multidrug transport system fused ATPase/permease subunit